MNKRLKAISSAIICIMSINLIAAISPVYAADAVTTVEYNYNDKKPGDTITGGKHSGFDAEWAEYANHPENGTTAIRFHQDNTPAAKTITMYYGDWQHQVSTAFFGDSSWSFDIYRESTAVDLAITLRGWEYDANGAAKRDMFMPSNAVVFGSDGTLKIFGENKGTYTAQTSYSIDLNAVLDPEAQMVKFTAVIEGGGQTYTAAKAYPDTSGSYKFFGNCYIQFSQTQAAAIKTVGDWIDNVTLTAAENQWISPQIDNGVAAKDTKSISFHSPRYIDQSTMGQVKITDEADNEISYEITYGRTLKNVKFNNNDFSNYAAEPIFTFSKTLEPGKYTIDFNGAVDHYGALIENITFQIPGAGDSSSIQSVTCGSIDGKNIKDIIKGTTGRDLIVLEDSAAKTAYFNKNGEAILDTTPLFGGETIQVTSANGNSTSTYTVTAQPDLYFYDFNDAKLADGIELQEGDIPNSVNRGSNPAATLNKAFPAGKFGQFFIDNPLSGKRHFAGVEIPLKNDRAGAIVMEGYTSAKGENASLKNDLIKTTEQGKNYAVNVCVRPASSVATRAQIMAGDRNSGKVLSVVDFNDVERKIKVNGQTVSGNSSLFFNDAWYTISFYTAYDEEHTKYIVKTFINGTWVHTNEVDQEYTNGIAMSLEQHTGNAKENYTAASCFDNISGYECAALEGNVLPNGFDFVPQVQSDMVTFDNIRGELTVPWMTAEELCDAIRLPDGVEAEVHTKDESSVLEGNEMVTEGMRLVLKNGEVWKSYSIHCAAYQNGTITLPENVAVCVYVMAAYHDGRLVNTSLAAENMMNVDLEEVDTIKCFAFSSFQDMKPLVKSWTIPIK